jgi:hypothetical protein
LIKAKPLVMFLAVILTGSCADTKGRWEHPGLPEQAWASDEADCRRRASDIVEREFRLLQQGRAGRDSRSSNVTAKIDQRDAQRRQTDLFNRCMIDKGYAQAHKED